MLQCKFFKNPDGSFTLFDNREDLLSNALADDAQEVVALKAKVTLDHNRKVVVKIPVTRQFITIIDPDILQWNLDESAINAARLLAISQ